MLALVLLKVKITQLTCGMIKDICKKLNINFVYKSSFDKANRTSSKSSRGWLEKGLSILSDVKKALIYQY